MPTFKSSCILIVIMLSGALFSQSGNFGDENTKVYSGSHLSAIGFNVGGVGAGSIRMDGAAVRKVWSIFNNKTQAFVPESFFAVRIKSKDTENVYTAAMQSREIEHFGKIKQIAFSGEYPLGCYRFSIPGINVDIQMEAYNPLIPLDLKNSSLPCAIFKLKAINNSTEPVEVSFLGTQQNAVGYAGNFEISGRTAPCYGTNINKIVKCDGASILHMTNQDPDTWRGSGDMALLIMAEDATATANFETLEKLYKDFSDDGKLDGPESITAKYPWVKKTNTTYSGALANSISLEPEEQKEVTFVLSWYFPNGYNGDFALANKSWNGQGNMYTNYFASALDVAKYVHANYNYLDQTTRLYHDSFYQTNLPRWLLDRISAQAAVLRSPTCFWAKDGTFGCWEGLFNDSGSCGGNCTHVWQYAQLHAHLFPQIARRMREQDFAHQTEDGGTPFRHMAGYNPATDGQLGSILGSYREHLRSPDDAWLKKNWPFIKKAMNYAINRWDSDENGVLSGPQHNTLDGALSGSTSWIGTLYLAALEACEKMAEITDDDQAEAYYNKISEQGKVLQDKTLFNGSYYIQIPDPDAEPRHNYNNGCSVDQLLGQWWACQLDLGWLYPRQRVTTAMSSLFNNNFKASLKGIERKTRRFVDDNDAGMQMITWPFNDRPENPIRYTDEIWTGTEYSAAAMMIYAGLNDKALTVLKAASDRHDGRNRPIATPYGLAVNANPFSDIECGMFYARPLSIWSVLLAYQGFFYDGPEKLIKFKPVWKPSAHKSFFTTAEGWGVIAQKRLAIAQVNTIEPKWGTVSLKTFAIKLPKEKTAKKCSVYYNGNRIEAAFEQNGQSAKVSFVEPILLRSDSRLEVMVRW